LALPEGMRGFIAQPFTGDLDEMVKRRLIRVGVVYNRTHYFVDKGRPASGTQPRRGAPQGA
jgi:hypothetical protein